MSNALIMIVVYISNYCDLDWTVIKTVPQNCIYIVLFGDFPSYIMHRRQRNFAQKKRKEDKETNDGVTHNIGSVYMKI